MRSFFLNFFALALLVARRTLLLCHGLCLPRRFLLIGYRALARTLAGAGIGMGALAANRQAAAVTIPAIGTDFDQALDVHRDIFAQIAFDVAAFFDDLTDAVDLVFVEVADLLGGLDIRRAKNVWRSASSRYRRCRSARS